MAWIHTHMDLLGRLDILALLVFSTWAYYKASALTR